MAAATFISSLKNTILTALLNAIDAGGAAGKIDIYTGTMPASPDTSISSQVLLGTLTFAYPCSAGAVSGSLTMNTITGDTEANASGVATWARISTSTDVAKIDIDVSNTTGSGALKLNTTSITKGGPINISSFVITL